MHKLKNFTGLLFIIMLLFSLLLAACGDSNTPTTAPTTTQNIKTTNSATSTPTSVATTAPTATQRITTTIAVTTASTSSAATTTVAIPTAANTNSDFVTTDVNSNFYLDNRSNALSILRSFYNAINRHEYVRAYSYWYSEASQLPPYPKFEQGYQDTTSVQLSFGQILSGAALGTEYATIPVLLNATDTKGNTQVFTGCYVFRQPHAANFVVPPFQPAGIDSGNLVNVPVGGNVKQLTAQACNKSVYSGTPTQISDNDNSAGAIDASQFLDDRSSAERVVRSLYNAVNRREYVRAYSYWEKGAANLQPYPQFEQGYKDTNSVQLTIGKITSDAGAGQLYSQVPVTIVSRITGDKVQTFVGCYLLHQSQPTFFAAPPFYGIGISRAILQEAPANADTKTLMGTACAKI